MSKLERITPTVKENWLIDTADEIESISMTEQEDLHDRDPFAWLLQQAGRLSRGEPGRIDGERIANNLIRQTEQLFDQWRSHCDDVLFAFLMLLHGSSASRSQCLKWKHSLRLARSRMAIMLYANPSMKTFVDAMIDYTWPSSRFRAAGELTALDYRIRRQSSSASMLTQHRTDWHRTLDEKCPWSSQEVIGFNHHDPEDSLDDPTVLPFLHRKRRIRTKP